MRLYSKLLFLDCAILCSEQFSELDEARRWGILGLPALEISRMLEQNLLNRFRETPEMQLRLKQERREEVGACRRCHATIFTYAGVIMVLLACIC